MTEHATVNMIGEDDGEPFAVVNVRIIEFERTHEGFCAGFYFAIPQPEGIEPTAGEVFIHGPFNSREEALREAGDFILEAAASEAERLTREEGLDAVIAEVDNA